MHLCIYYNLINDDCNSRSWKINHPNKYQIIPTLLHYIIILLIKMGKLLHPFRPYFELISNPNNESNKFGVCLCCIEEYSWNIAITKKECHVINKAKSCHDHLKQCENFKKRYNESEYTEILALNNKRKGKFDIIEVICNCTSKVLF